MERRVFYIFLAPLFLALTTGFTKARAYTVSITADILSENVEEGHIVSSNSDTYILSDKPYSDGVAGVVNNNPEIAIFEKDKENPTYIAVTGNVPVKVSAKNGKITAGDYITTSEVPGVGMKATQSGYIIGEALESFAPENSESQGLISVNLDIKNVFISSEPSKGFLGLFRKDPTGILNSMGINNPTRYILATVITIISFTIGMSAYIRVALSGMHAIETHPKAHEFVETETKTAVIVSSVIILSGLLLSYLILTL